MEKPKVPEAAINKLHKVSPTRESTVREVFLDPLREIVGTEDNETSSMIFGLFEGSFSKLSSLSILEQPFASLCSLLFNLIPEKSKMDYEKACNEALVYFSQQIQIHLQYPDIFASPKKRTVEKEIKSRSEIEERFKFMLDSIHKREMDNYQQLEDITNRLLKKVERCVKEKLVSSESGPWIVYVVQPEISYERQNGTRGYKQNSYVITSDDARNIKWVQPYSRDQF